MYFTLEPLEIKASFRQRGWLCAFEFAFAFEDETKLSYQEAAKKCDTETSSIFCHVKQKLAYSFSI